MNKNKSIKPPWNITVHDPPEVKAVLVPIMQPNQASAHQH